MSQFTRRVALRDASLLPRAKAVAYELNRHLANTHKIKVHVGTPVDGSSSSMVWLFDAPSFDGLEDLNERLLQDQDYWALIEKNRDLWVSGPKRDGIVNLINR